MSTLNMTKEQYASINPIARKLKPPNSDYVLHWVRHRILINDTEEDEYNIAEHKALGWLPVNPALYPDMPCINGRIEHGGLVLYMKVRIDIDALEKKNKALCEWNDRVNQELGEAETANNCLKAILKPLL